MTVPVTERGTCAVCRRPIFLTLFGGWQHQTPATDLVPATHHARPVRDDQPDPNEILG